MIYIPQNQMGNCLAALFVKQEDMLDGISTLIEALMIVKAKVSLGNGFIRVHSAPDWVMEEISHYGMRMIDLKNG